MLGCGGDVSGADPLLAIAGAHIAPSEAVEYGVRSGLVDDNLAWSLVDLGVLPEAVALWQELEDCSTKMSSRQCPDKGFRATLLKSIDFLS